MPRKKPVAPCVIEIRVEITGSNRKKISGRKYGALPTPAQIAATLRQEMQYAITDLTSPFAKSVVRARIKATGRVGIARK